MHINVITVIFLQGSADVDRAGYDSVLRAVLCAITNAMPNVKQCRLFDLAERQPATLAIREGFESHQQQAVLGMVRACLTPGRVIMT